MPRFHRPLLSLGAFLAGLSLVLPAHAQSYTHYWSHQFGREGILLAGSVLAGTEDNTTVIYNPAALAFTKGQGLALSFLSAGIANLKLKDGLGEGLDIKASSLFILPKFLAYDLPVLKKNPGKMVFVLYHQDFPSMNQAFRDAYIPESDPGVIRVTNFDLDKDVSEVWGGLAYAYPLSNEWAAGVSLLFPFRAQSYYLQLSIDEMDAADNQKALALNSLGYRLNYSVFSVTSKLGLAYRPAWNPSLRLGLTFATPSLFYMFNSGHYEYQILYTRDADPDNPEFFQIENKQTDARAVYKYPMSLGLGLQYTFGDLSLSASVEHFFRINPYAVMEDNPDPYNGHLPDATIPNFPLMTKSETITNFAIGATYRLREGLELLGGFQTDHNFYGSPLPNQPIQLFNSGWDQYHISLGTSLLVNRNEISIGLRYSFSFQNDVYGIGHIDEGDNGIFDLLERNQTADVRFNAFALAFTYNFFREILPSTRE